MLYLSTKLKDLPLLSLRIGGRIGTINEPIINPHNLHIDGFYCSLQNSHQEQVLLDMSVRNLSVKGIIINDHNDVGTPDELIRLQPIMDIHYQLIGKHVVAGKKTVGKVVDYAVDAESLFIQKLYVQPPVWQAMNQNHLTFDRLTIIEVTDKQIIVRGPEVRVKKADAAKKSTLLQDYSASASLTEE